jgi:uncharacterized protein
MAVLVNLRNLEKGAVRLKGELAPAELELEGVDEVIHVEGMVNYDLTAEKLEKSILVRGYVGLQLKCDCVRCLQPFLRPLELSEWTCLLELEGDEATPVANDCVDLTPHLREDILLEYPQHPLCKAECDGLPKKPTGKTGRTGGAGQETVVLSDWAELNKLKL